MRLRGVWVLGIAAAVAVAAGAYLFFGHSWDSTQPLRIAMAPYQDLAMMVNAKPLGLEKKYGTKIELLTMAWEDIPPAVASAGRGADVGFGSYIEYLTKYEKLNAGSSDPVLFIYPLYVFKGGAFVTFKPGVPTLTPASINDPSSTAVRQVLGGRLGAQRASVYEMMLNDLASRHGVNPAKLQIIDTPLDQGFLAASRGDLDIAEAGLTQLSETARLGGRTVFTMDALGFADITGFIVKKSVYDRRRKDIENAIRMWFDSVNYVYSDIDKNSTQSLAYLNQNASTRYTLTEYKQALSQEYLPRTIASAQRAFIAPTSQFSAQRIGTSVDAYLVRTHTITTPTPIPQFAPVQ